MMMMKITKPTISPMICFLNVNNVYSAATELEPLFAPQATLKHDGYTFSNCFLLHKLLITGQGEQVVSRRGELNRDLLSSTCKFGPYSKVRCKIGLIKFLAHAGTKQHRNSNVQFRNIIIE